MGREIRMVPAGWDHPKTMRHWGKEDHQPMYDRTYASAVAEWKADFAKWEAGERRSYFDPADYPDGVEYWEWESTPPERAYYRPWLDDEAVWFQVWETVSEGTPVTPPFATKEELVDYLVEHGDFWDQKRGDGGWSREGAERFVGSGWSPSMMVVASAEGNTVLTPRDGIA